MLGSELLLQVPKGRTAIGTDVRPAPDGHPEVREAGVDLSDAKQVEALLDRSGPLAGVIHAAAYTAVDKAEEEESLAQKINGDLCAVLARACAARALPLVLVSTDFVFDGDKGSAYLESDEPHPLSAYGRTKLSGELQATQEHPDGTRIVRTQWLYGPRGAHFPGTICRLGRERGELKVVSDQLGSPTSTLELAPALWDVLTRGEAGVYHAACEGICSWYDFAAEVLKLAGLEKVRIEACGSEEFPRPAHRPANSALSCARLTALRKAPMAGWQAGLARFAAAGGLS